MADDWTVEVTVKPGASAQEDHRALRHHPAVVAQITNIAKQIVNATGSPNDFEVLVQNQSNTQRARAFAKPATWHGVRLELRDSLLLKAAGSAGHQDLRDAPPSDLMDMGESQGDFTVKSTTGIRQDK